MTAGYTNQTDSNTVTTIPGGPPASVFATFDTAGSNTGNQAFLRAAGRRRFLCDHALFRRAADLCRHRQPGVRHRGQRAGRGRQRRRVQAGGRRQYGDCQSPSRARRPAARDLRSTSINDASSYAAFLDAMAVSRVLPTGDAALKADGRRLDPMGAPPGRSSPARSRSTPSARARRSGRSTAHTTGATTLFRVTADGTSGETTAPVQLVAGGPQLLRQRQFAGRRPVHLGRRQRRQFRQGRRPPDGEPDRAAAHLHAGRRRHGLRRQRRLHAHRKPRHRRAGQRIGRCGGRTGC